MTRPENKEKQASSVFSCLPNVHAYSLLLWWLNSSLIYSLPCMSFKGARWIPKMWSSYSPGSQPHLIISSPSRYFGRNVAAPKEHCLLDHLHKGYFISFIQTGRIIILLVHHLYFKMLSTFLPKKKRKKEILACLIQQSEIPSSVPVNLQTS